jgi:polyisoprenoid-binding protein YceI
MKRHFVITVLTVAAATALPVTRVGAQGSPAPAAAGSTVEVRGGTATFDAPTNVSAISVHGKSTEVQGRAVVRQAGDGIAIDQLEANLPVKSITTGLGLRDDHMRKHIFTTSDGQMPDLKFSSETASCAPASSGESTCTLSGTLAIRGAGRPFTIALKVKKTGDAYHAEGDSIVKLSTYGIERPSQFAVTTTDDVKLHLEFTAKPAANAIASRTGGVR